MNDFGKTLNGLRKAKGWTQTELADKLGVTNQAISKWENGDSFPDTAILIPLSELFGVTTDYLLKGKYNTANDTDKTNSSAAKEKNDAEKPEELTSNKPNDWKKKFALLLCTGLGIIFLGVIEIILVALLNEDFILYGTSLMILFFAAGVPVLVYAGIKDSMYYLNINDSRWQPGIRAFAVKIAVGVALCIIAAATFVLCGLAEEYPQSETLILAITLSAAFLLIFAATAFFITGGLSLSNLTRSCAPDYIDHKKKEEGLGRFSGVVMLVATAVYLLFGFLKEIWHPTWVVFVAGGIICAILGVIDDALGKKKNR